MRVLADIHLTTIGGSISLSGYVAELVEELNRRGVPHYLHAFGTNVECDLAELKEITEWIISNIHAKGEQRIFIDIRLTARFDRTQDIQEKIGAVVSRLGGGE